MQWGLCVVSRQESKLLDILTGMVSRSSYSCTYDAIGLFTLRMLLFLLWMLTFGTYQSVLLVRYRHACVEKSNATRSVAG